MKKMKLLMICLTALVALSGCGSKNDKYIMEENTKEKIELSDFSEPDTGILPKRFEYIQYSGIVPEGYEGKEHDNSEYPPEMFWGTWVLKSFNGKEVSEIETDEKIMISDELAAECLPNEFYLGYQASEIGKTGKGFADLLPGYAEYTSLPGARRREIVFDTSGTTLSFGILQYNDGEIFYGESSTEADVLCEIDYAFSWTGWELTLAYGDQMATYVPSQIANEEQGIPSIAHATLVNGYQAFDDIEEVTLFVPMDQEYNSQICYSDSESNSLNEYYAEVIYGQDGKTNIHILPANSILSDGEKNDCTYEAEFFYSGSAFTLVSDNVKSVYSSYADRYADRLADSVDGEMLEQLKKDQLEELAKRQLTIQNKIQEAFANAGLDVEIDETTGRITMDANILFGFDDATLSEEGKILLDKFISVYVPVVLDDECEGYISEIIIEGHTDTTGGYDYNLQLSKDRASAVADYFENESVSSLTAEELAAFNQKVITEGKSFESPVYNTDGTVNMEASRRVTFRFMLNVDGIE